MKKAILLSTLMITSTFAAAKEAPLTAEDMSSVVSTVELEPHLTYMPVNPVSKIASFLPAEDVARFLSLNTHLHKLGAGVVNRLVKDKNFLTAALEDKNSKNAKLVATHLKGSLLAKALNFRHEGKTADYHKTLAEMIALDRTKAMAIAILKHELTLRVSFSIIKLLKKVFSNARIAELVLQHKDKIATSHNRNSLIATAAVLRGSDIELSTELLTIEQQFGASADSEIARKVWGVDKRGLVHYRKDLQHIKTVFSAETTVEQIAELLKASKVGVLRVGSVLNSVLGEHEHGDLVKNWKKTPGALGKAAELKGLFADKPELTTKATALLKRAVASMDRLIADYK